MTCGSVEFERDGVKLVAELSDGGWTCPGQPAFAAILNIAADPRSFGLEPDPVASAVAMAARTLKGKGCVGPLPPPGTSC
jgi:hypothetical protein